MCHERTGCEGSFFSDFLDNVVLGAQRLANSIGGPDKAVDAPLRPVEGPWHAVVTLPETVRDAAQALQVERARAPKRQRHVSRLLRLSTFLAAHGKLVRPLSRQRVSLEDLTTSSKRWSPPVTRRERASTQRRARATAPCKSSDDEAHDDSFRGSRRSARAGSPFPERAGKHPEETPHETAV
jgi:hypothetical protein